MSWHGLDDAGLRCAGVAQFGEGHQADVVQWMQRR
jgi:hypothetical protein